MPSLPSSRVCFRLLRGRENAPWARSLDLLLSAIPAPLVDFCAVETQCNCEVTDPVRVKVSVLLVLLLQDSTLLTVQVAAMETLVGLCRLARAAIRLVSLRLGEALRLLFTLPGFHRHLSSVGILGFRRKLPTLCLL